MLFFHVFVGEGYREGGGGGETSWCSLVPSFKQHCCTRFALFCSYPTHPVHALVGLSLLSWTSKGMPVDAISAQGPGGTAEPYLIGVFAIMDVTFSVSATFSQVRFPPKFSSPPLNIFFFHFFSVGFAVAVVIALSPVCFLPVSVHFCSCFAFASCFFFIFCL